MLCRACQTSHDPLLSCSRAARVRESEVKRELPKPAEMVVHTDPSVVHKAPDGSSRHGVYKDHEARKAYRREWMRAIRHAKRTQPAKPEQP